MKDKNLFIDIKQIIILMWIINFCCVLISFIFGFSAKVLLGFLFGCIYMSWNIYHLGITINKGIEKKSGNNKSYMLLNLILRYGIFTIIFALCYYFNIANIISLLLPLFYPKLAFGLKFLIFRKEEIK